MIHFFDNFNLFIDGYLIMLYRMTGIGIIDYFIGTLLLSLAAVVVGEVCVVVAIRFNKGHIQHLTSETDRMERMSIAAYEKGDLKSYKALNKSATDSWGRQFFTLAAYSAGILWPIPFILGWMQFRFNEVNFLVAYPLRLITGETVGYLFTFFPIYILARIMFKYLRPWIPFFRKSDSTSLMKTADAH
ncbi:MAG: hypothetical protein HKM93_20115 [Desulfobacteraceae bacterium]|nr:hypothetical protein [Desulfobacteraceae bacterium]